MRILADRASMATEASLRNLKSGTTYYGIVRELPDDASSTQPVKFEALAPNAPDPLCKNIVFKAPFVLQTPSEEDALGLRSSPKPQLPITLGEGEIIPNPTTGICRVLMKEKGYQTARITEVATGRLLQDMKIQADSQSLELDLTGNAPGLYLVRFESTEKRPYSVPIVLISEK